MANKRNIAWKNAGKIVSIFCLLSLGSCTSDPVVASVDDSELTQSDAQVLMKHLGYDIENQDDWMSFIDFWVDRQVFLEELKESNPNEYKLVQLRASSFQGELARHYIEEDFLSKKINQKVTKADIENYYNANKSVFALNDYIVKALYLKVPKDAPKQSEIKEHYLLKNDKDFPKVISYAKLYAENFYFDDKAWIYFDELTKDAPIEKLNKENLVLNRTKTHFSDEEFTYYLNIIDYKLKDATPPVDFMKEEIKQIILTQRLNAIKDKTESEFIKNVKNKHEIKINL